MVHIFWTRCVRIVFFWPILFGRNQHCNPCFLGIGDVLWVCYLRNFFCVMFLGFMWSVGWWLDEFCFFWGVDLSLERFRGVSDVFWFEDKNYGLYRILGLCDIVCNWVVCVELLWGRCFRGHIERSGFFFGNWMDLGCCGVVGVYFWFWCEFSVIYFLGWNFFGVWCWVIEVGWWDFLDLGWVYWFLGMIEFWLLIVVGFLVVILGIIYGYFGWWLEFVWWWE